MGYPIATLHPGSDIHLKNRHHAIFRSAVASFPTGANGEIVEIRGSDNSFLCYAHWNAAAFICGRAIAFEQRDPKEQLRDTMAKAIAMRSRMIAADDTDAVRLINAEGDAIPGLVVDRYGDVLAVQLTTLGMDRLREWITDVLVELTGCSAVFEKSTAASRKKEGLEPVEGWLRGKGDEVITVTERGLRYKIGLEGSQKTGLFLDQREMRSLVRSLSNGRTVLDICSYVGGFTVSALKGGAIAADAVDYDGLALDRVREHVQINGLDEGACNTYPEDAFTYLRRAPRPRAYDFIILDPPAFAKRSTDIEQAKKAYTDLNRLALEMLPPGGLLLTCSCSYQMDPSLFQSVVFHAAHQAKRSVKILSRHRQAVDHPVNLFHPETEYLKSLLLWVE